MQELKERLKKSLQQNSKDEVDSKEKQQLKLISLPTCLISFISSFLNQYEHHEYILICRLVYIYTLESLSNVAGNSRLFQMDTISTNRWKSVEVLELTCMTTVEWRRRVEFPALKKLVINNMSKNLLNEIIFDCKKLQQLVMDWFVVENDADFENLIHLFKGGNIRKLSLESIRSSYPYHTIFWQKVIAVNWKQIFNKLAVLIMKKVDIKLEESLFDAVKHELQYCESKKCGWMLSSLKNSSLTSIDVVNYEEMLKYKRNIDLNKVTCMRFTAGFDVNGGNEYKEFLEFLCNPSLRDIVFCNCNEKFLQVLGNESIYKNKQMIVISISQYTLPNQVKWTENSYSLKKALKLILIILNEQKMNWCVEFDNVPVSRKLFYWLVELAGKYNNVMCYEKSISLKHYILLKCYITCKFGIDGWYRSYLWDNNHHLCI